MYFLSKKRLGGENMKYLEYEEYKETLKEMIEKLLNGNWSFTKFKDEFCKFYLEQVPGEIISDDEWYFYSIIVEGLINKSAKSQ